MTDTSDPCATFDAAIRVREEHYEELRQAVAALLYARNKLAADGASAEELAPIHAEVDEAKHNLARRYAEIQALGREKLRAVAILSAARAHRGRHTEPDSDSDAGLDSARSYIEQLAAEHVLNRELDS